MGTTVVFGMFVFLTNRKYRIGIVSSKSAETANVSVIACSKKYGDLIKIQSELTDLFTMATNNEWNHIPIRQTYFQHLKEQKQNYIKKL